MSSIIQSVLVANATNDIQNIAVQQAKQNNQQDTLYLAKGDFMEMNGIYSAGILEGIVHSIPQADRGLRGAE